MSKRSQQQLCAVTIGIDHHILPMADGLKLVDIMAKAIAAERNYGSGGKKWHLRERSDLNSVGLELVRPDEIEFPHETKAGMRRLALPGVAS